MFTFWDYMAFVLYAVVILGVGLWVSREKKGHKKNAEDYFLASKGLPWWAIGASVIAANISAEQFIGMSGSGFAIGLGIASYEWMGAATLIIVGKFFLPIFLDKGIYTMPQFLEVRYDGRVRLALAIFWLLVYVFVNLTSVMYLGALALETIMGVPLIYGIIALALFAALYSIYGGLKAVAWTDVIQVIFLVAGGLITTWLALDAVADKFGVNGPLNGFVELMKQAPEKFNMIIHKGELLVPNGTNGGTRDAFQDLPGISVLVGGLWVANLAYFGFNQYIIQRGLAAKSVDEAQKGMIFAGFLKILTPLIVVLPGIAAFVLTRNTDVVIDPSDKAYPWLLHTFIPTGVKGLTFAALAAAIVSSLASMLNSTSTIFTMDIYKKHIRPEASQTHLVTIGRLTSFTALVIAVFVARPLLGGLDQAFQFIQDFTGMITPGVLAIFGLGMFWKKAHANGALLTAILTIPLGFAFKALMPNLPFMNRMGIVFLILATILIVVSLLESKADDPNGLIMKKDYFRTSKGFNIGAIIISLILIVFYTVWW
ncbi:sodium/sugar symporter [Prolixibacter denitrificans]|jgi:SSS family solute:Na+ symporter|uniref:SSS family solute:Na+ symporter n=1 Tax=Prolixibacter denitrificans TaxID=1541063 RepID=A0A2P8C9U4_9BACT|nr:sodium/sugar symporter [Prolixibacter denitrificans]PSK81733.1 SSS family solute:Na+ symporter [Prolixibacter denitrificans]GET21254.1 sodium transporter [Prolixibacter denitrificans]